MPAQKPQRPAPGRSMTLPRVDDEATQRALDQIKQSTVQTIATLATAQATAVAAQTAATAAAGGRLLRAAQTLTGSGTYTPAPGTNLVHVRQVGGGGGGGGVGGGAGLAGGGGGNSGFYLEYWLALTTGGGAFVCGAAGSAGTTAPTAGGTGGDTTLVLNGTTITAKGGTGGTAAALSANGLSGPNIPASGSTVIGIVSFDGGGLGFWFNTAVVASGYGGMSPLGTGGFAVAAGTGIAGTGGGGGSGGATSAGSAAGGAGGAGLIIIEEYS